MFDLCVGRLPRVLMRSALFLAPRAAGLVAALAAASPLFAQPASPPPAGQQQATAEQPIQIDRNGVLILIRSTLLALDHANRTGNYTVLRDLGAPGFHNANSAARLAEIFANLRTQNIDLSGVSVLDPQLTVLPTAVQGGMMRMAGFFPSVPTQVNFEMLFAPIEGRWRLFGIAVQLGQAAPAAPTPQQPEKPASQPSGPKPEARSDQKKPRQKPSTAPSSTRGAQPGRATPQRPPASAQDPQ
jgi:hypothetical protein